MRREKWTHAVTGRIAKCDGRDDRSRFEMQSLGKLIGILKGKEIRGRAPINNSRLGQQLADITESVVDAVEDSEGDLRSHTGFLGVSFRASVDSGTLEGDFPLCG